MSPTKYLTKSINSNFIINQCYDRTHLKSFPSNFLALVNSTVLAGIFKPIANVSVANNAYKVKMLAINCPQQARALRWQHDKFEEPSIIYLTTCDYDPSKISFYLNELFTKQNFYGFFQKR